MRYPSENRKKKLILYYLLAIVLPCMALGILAFRGVKNDKALLEREKRNLLKETHLSLTENLRDSLAEMENYLSGNLDLLAIRSERIFQDSVICRQLNRYPFIMGIFLLHPDHKVQLLDHRMSYYPDDIPLSSLTMVNPPLNAGKYLAGWQMEFGDKNLTGALRYYRRALGQAQSMSEKGTLLQIIARIQTKLNEMDQAALSYRKIIDEFRGVFINERFPLEMVAYRELANLGLSAGDSILYLNQTTQLLSGMKDGKWVMHRSWYNNLLKETEEMLFSFSSPGEKYQLEIAKVKGIVQELKSDASQMESLFSLVPNASTINEEFRSWKADRRRGIIRYGGQDHFLARAGQKNGVIIGVIYDLQTLPEYFSQMIISQVTEQSEHSETRLLTQHTSSGPNGTEDGFKVITRLPTDLPDWSLESVEHQGVSFASVLQSRAGIYFYVFLIILVVLILGLGLVLQTIQNELRLSQMKSNFISTVSHEFKSPLTSIRQLTEMLQEGRVQDEQRKQVYYAGIMQQSDRLKHLIDNILDFSRMESENNLLRLQKGDLQETVKEIIAGYRIIMQLGPRKIKETYADSNITFYFDREAVKQIITNLLDNALKYSNDDIDVKISFGSSQAMISITDTGIGIPKAEQAKIFDRFYRAGDELTQNVKGSGIGLTIVRKLVESHGGKIEVASTIGKGSTFTVFLPIKQYAPNEKDTDH